MGMGHKDLFVRLGTQADRLTTAAAFTDVAVPADGDSLSPSLEIENLDTDHGNAGVLYSAVNSRNGEEVSLNTYLYPNIAGIVFDGVINRDGNGDLTYHTVEAWWGESIGSGEAHGVRRRGVIFNGFTLSIERTGPGQRIAMDIPSFLNRKTMIEDAEATPTPDFSDYLPYSTTGALIDFRHDNSVDTAFGAHNSSVRRLTITYANQTTVEGFTDDSTDATLDKVWTLQEPGEQTCTVEVTVSIDDDKYLRLDENSVPPTGSLRVALTHSSATLSVTSTSTLTAGDNDTQTLAVSADPTTNGAVGQVAVIEHPTAGFSVLPIAAVRSGPDEIDFDTDTAGSGFDSRVTLNGASGGPLTIRNMAIGLTLDSMKFQSQGPLVRDGNRRSITLNYEASLASGATSIIEHHAYNHANA